METIQAENSAPAVGGEGSEACEDRVGSAILLGCASSQVNARIEQDPVVCEDIYFQEVSSDLRAMRAGDGFCA